MYVCTKYLHCLWFCSKWRWQPKNLTLKGTPPFDFYYTSSQILSLSLLNSMIKFLVSNCHGCLHLNLGLLLLANMWEVCWLLGSSSIIKFNWGTPFYQNPFMGNGDIGCARKLSLCTQAKYVAKSNLIVVVIFVVSRQFARSTTILKNGAKRSDK